MGLINAISHTYKYASSFRPLDYERVYLPLYLYYERVYLPLHKVADTPFHSQGDLKLQIALELPASNEATIETSNSVGPHN